MTSSQTPTQEWNKLLSINFNTFDYILDYLNKENYQKFKFMARKKKDKRPTFSVKVFHDFKNIPLQCKMGVVDDIFDVYIGTTMEETAVKLRNIFVNATSHRKMTTCIIKLYKAGRDEEWVLRKKKDTP
tara:strand:+ start:464 stop:850 length:387 start_codon:yes stop_codon:yes gene_type:complete